MSMNELFFLAVFALVAIIIICSVKAYEKMMNSLHGFEVRIPDERDLEILADMKRTRLRILDIGLSILDSYENPLPAELSENDDYLNKFNASKARRKQSPSSPATPVVKSKRKRK